MRKPCGPGVSPPPSQTPGYEAIHLSQKTRSYASCYGDDGGKSLRQYWDQTSHLTFCVAKKVIAARSWLYSQYHISLGPFQNMPHTYLSDTLPHFNTPHTYLSDTLPHFNTPHTYLSGTLPTLPTCNAVGSRTGMGEGERQLGIRVTHVPIPRTTIPDSPSRSKHCR